TTFGQLIILMLIQIGGLGIMTFASYFAYFFRGSASFHNQLALQDMTSTERIGEVFAVLKRILFLTFLIEGLGALLIFYSVGTSVGGDLADRVFFSVFHAISAFCNGGFSILSNGLFEPIVKFNYPLQWIIACLIILGGLGFPIIFNLFRYISTIVTNRLRKLFTKKPAIHLPWIVNINTRIVIITTSILLIVGWLFFFLSEYNQTLSDHQLFGKISGAFFTSVTTRTAGFNSIDFAAMGIPATLLVIFLMWVGASPASTGGGIKTSTLAVAVLNFFSLAKNRTKIEIFKREIAVSSVQRASAIIMLSIFVIGIAVILLSFTDPDKGLLNLVFETVSAYATVGLSRGITSGLSEAGKIIIMITMFIGRVNMLTILTAFFNKFSSPAYKYPSETILIN
ncbi:MAG: potassium transporter TrkG, partial [Bacteroidales bacterium]|nr:potassium transporter TrkG [Bacteroidales bacterium]